MRKNEKFMLREWNDIKKQIKETKKVKQFEKQCMDKETGILI